MDIHITITTFFQERLLNVLREAAIFSQEQSHKENTIRRQRKLDDIAHE